MYMYYMYVYMYDYRIIPEAPRYGNIVHVVQIARSEYTLITCTQSLAIC